MEEIKKLSEREVIEIVMDIIESNLHLDKESFIDSDNLEQAEYYGEIYVDYRDELSKDSLQKICEASNPREALYELLNEWELDAGDYESDYVFKTIKDNWDEEEHGDFDDYEWDINEYVNQNIHFNYPVGHFTKQDVNLNIIIDNGDGDQDFTLNNIASYNTDYEEPIDDESALVWLVEQQGYTKQDLEEARDLYSEGNWGKIPSRLIKTIIQEAQNVTTHMNALTFFVKMTLEQYMDLKENKSSIILSKDTRCGLYDPWAGAGSIHEIELEKDVVIPWDKMEPDVEGARGYGVDQIYGVFK
jgi:hypothetical protein